MGLYSKNTGVRQLSPPLPPLLVLSCRTLLATCSLHWREDLSQNRDGMAPVVTIMHYTKVCASFHTDFHRIKWLKRIHGCGKPSTLTHAKTPNTSIALGRIGDKKRKNLHTGWTADANSEWSLLQRILCPTACLHATNNICEDTDKRCWISDVFFSHIFLLHYTSCFSPDVASIFLWIFQLHLPEGSFAWHNGNIQLMYLAKLTGKYAMHH